MEKVLVTGWVLIGSCAYRKLCLYMNSGSYLKGVV